MMAKIQKIETADFDFLKLPEKQHQNCLEQVIGGCFFFIFIALMFLFFNASVYNLDTKSPSNNKNLKDTSEKVLPKYQDYHVTPEDKKHFAQIFDYNSQHSVIKDEEAIFFNDSIKKSDLANADFVSDKDNKDIKNNKNMDSFTVSSHILAIDSADKNEIVKEQGNGENSDYVDLVVQKTYRKNQEVYYEQQLVNVVLDNHKIVSLNTHRMID